MLSVRNASVYFEARDGRTVHALEQVSLDIAAGEFVVALGTSGCGKSTLLNAMAGFLPLSEGSITLNGQPVQGPGPERGVVFQKDTLLPWMSVIDNVALGLQFAAVPKAEQRRKAQGLLELVGLKDFAWSAPYELSGGMRQRVGLARALATEPEILLMDEPFGALDSMTRQHMQEQLAGIWARTHKQVFFITHSIEEALFLGTRVVVMSPRPGRIAACFETDFVRRFAQGESARNIKRDAVFVALREEIYDIVHRTETLQQELA